LAPGTFTLVARNAFGDLFLRDAEGRIHWLEVNGGTLIEIANTSNAFLQMLDSGDMAEIEDAETDAREFAQTGLLPGPDECIGFKIPLVFEESSEVDENTYIADLYQCVSFLGDIHRQIRDLPDGSKVELTIR